MRTRSDRGVGAGLLVLRTVVGGLFAGHGAQKLFGSFGGGGVSGTAEAFESMGLRPGKAAASFAGAAEFGGGVLLATGLLTPLAAAATSGSMVGAIAAVHAPHGPWVAEGGWEYNAVLIAAATTLSLAGPGALSLDRALGIERRGARWALAQLAAAVAGGLGAVALGKRLAPSGANGSDPQDGAG